MTIELPERILEELEKDVSSLRRPHQRAEKFAKVQEIYDKRGERDKVEQMQWEINLLYQLPVSFRLQREKVGSRFNPYSEKLIIPECGLDYFEKRVRETSNPIHRALYSDFLWERGRSYKYAEIAIDSYLECANIYLRNDWHIEMADAIDRAVELSLKLNNPEKIENAREKTLQLLESLQSKEKFRFCLELSESLLEMKDKMDSNVSVRVMSILERGVDYYSKSDNFGFARSFQSRLIQYAMLLDRKDLATKYRYEIASSFEVEGDQRMNESGLIASHFYEEAIRAFRSLGETENVEALLLKLKTAYRKAVTEMKVIEVPIEIPSSEIEQIIERFASSDLEEALKKIATSQDLVPSFTNASKLAEKMRKEHPVSFMVFPRTHVRQANPIAKSIDETAILDDHITEYFSMEYQWKMDLLLTKILDRLQQKGLDSLKLIEYLSSSRLYATMNLSIIKTGFERYFDQDYVSAIHILTPQLENVLRNLLGKLGEPTSKVKGDIIIEQPLDDILRNQEIRKFLGEDIFHYFNTFLVDHRAENLRHDVAHGLVDLESCTKRNAVTLMHQFLILTRFEL